MSDGSIMPRVLSLAESIEEDGFGEDDVLEHKYTVDDRGNVTEVRAVVTVGGPYLYVDCLSGVVGGSWGGDSHRVPLFDEEAEGDVQHYGQMQADRMEARIE